MSEKSVFMTLSELNMEGKHKQKGNNTYLPWSSAWYAIKTHYPDATYHVVKTEDGCLYHTDGKTCWVETSVTINGETQNETLAVMNHRNASIAADEVTSTDVGRAIKRCMVKNAALFGLDLNLWNGEELSDTAKAAKAKKKAEDDKKKQQEAAELDKIHQAIIDMASAKKEAGADVEAIYAIVQQYAGGKKNPKAIKNIDDANACLKAVEAFK